MYRIGHGYDSHIFTEGKYITLAGVTIPFEKGLQSHSDGDVVVHSLCDAFLGAASLGDMGQHFPDSDQKYAGAQSKVFLNIVKGLVQEEGFIICNTDTTIVLEKPKLQKYILNMRENLASELKLSASVISIKAKTNEGMGFIGAGEGIAAFSVVMLKTDK